MRKIKLHSHTLVKFIVSRFPNQNNAYPDNISVRELGTMDGYVLSGRLCRGMRTSDESCPFHDAKMVIENAANSGVPLTVTFVKKYRKRFIQSAVAVDVT